MSATHAPETAGPVQSGARTNRGLVVLVTALTVITLGLAGWLAYTLAQTPETALSDDVATVVEDYHDAWNAYDGEAFLTMVTSDYRFNSEPGDPGESAEATAQMISNDLRAIGWAVTQLDVPRMVGDDTRVLVSAANRLTATSSIQESDGFSLITLVKDGGSWKVRSHVFVAR